MTNRYRDGGRQRRGAVALQPKAVRQAVSAGWCEDVRSWRGVAELWMAGMRYGGIALWRSVEATRRQVFKQPVQLGRAISIGYSSPPAALHDELAWLKAIGVRQVSIPLEQAAAEVRRNKALAAIENLRAEGCEVAVVLQPNLRPEATVEGWRLFCEWALAQAGWQVARAQLGARLDVGRGDKSAAKRVAALFADVPQLRRDYPGVALIAPEVVARGEPLGLATVGGTACSWDGAGCDGTDWRNRLGEACYLRKLVLARAALRAAGGVGGLDVHLPALPEGATQEVARAGMDSVVRRSVLALASGLADRVVLEVDPEADPGRREMFAAAVRGLTATLDGARFVRRVAVRGPAGVELFEFVRANRDPLLVGWCGDEPVQVSVACEVCQAMDVQGESVPLLPYPKLRLTRRTAFFLGGVTAPESGT